MPQPVARAVIIRESDLTAADGLRPAVSGYSFYRLVSPYRALNRDVPELPCPSNSGCCKTTRGQGVRWLAHCRFFPVVGPELA